MVIYLESAMTGVNNLLNANILDATTALVKFVDETNLLKGALTGLATFGGIKAFMTIKTGAMEAYVELNKFKNAMDIVKSTNISTAQFDKLLLLSEGLSKSQMKQVLSTNSLTMAQKKQLLMVSGLSEEESVAALQAWKMTAANNGLTASTTSASNAFKGLTMMIKANPFMIAVTAITIGVAAWQKYKQSIEDVKDRIDELSDSISTLESEYKSLKETGSENLTDTEQARLQYLEDRIEREKELKELEEARLIREKYGSNFTDYFDEDNQNAKYSDFREKYLDGMSKVDVTSLAYGIDHDEQNVIDIGSKIDEYKAAQEKIQSYVEQMNRHSSDEQGYIWADELKSQEEDNLEKLIPQLQEEYQNYKEAKYEAETAIDEMTQDLDNPNLTDKDKETIQSWIAQYQDVVKIADYYIGLMRDIPAIPSDTDTNTYHNWYSKLSDDEKELANSDDFKEALEKQKEGLGKAALAANDYDIALQEVKNAQASVANSGDGIETTSFSDTITELSDLQDDLSDLDEAMANIVSDGNVDLSSLDGLIEAFGKLEEAGKNIDTSTVDEAMKSLSDATSIQSAQQALDTLCTEYIKASGILDNLNESNKNLIATRLQGMGVANAEEMVEARLAAQKYATANGCIDLANATWEEISALIAEGDASQETQQYLANLALSKIDVNNIKLDTKADVDNIIAIANAAGASAAQIAALKTALASLSNAKIDKWANSGGGMNSLNLMNPAKLNTPSSGNSKIDQFAKQQQAQKAKDAVQDATDTLAKTLDDIKNGAYNLDASNFYANYSGGSATSKAVNDAAKAAKDAAKDVKEAVAETFDFIENGINRFDKALSKLEDKVGKTSSSFTSRLNAYKEALNATTFGIELLTDDYNKYMQKANEVGLNEDIASAVRGGASNIWDYTDDTVKQQIKDYQSWYDKAQDCLDKIDELKDKQLELTQASIELLITQYEKLATKIENVNDRTEKWISLKESWGFSANTKNYDSMNKNIQKQIDFIIKQDEQLKLLQKTVAKGSEAWYEYNERIDSNKASLIDLKQQMQENATAAAVLAKATADKKTEKYDSQDELYDAKIDNATSAKSKNKLIDKKISNINKTQKAYNTAVSTDNKNLKSAKKTISKFKSTKENKKILASIKKAAKSGKRISQSLLNKASKLNDNGKLYNACVQYNAYLDAKEADKATADLYKETAKQDKATLAKEKFDNISSDYENKISSNEQKKTSLNNKISLAQEQGKQVSAAYYKSLISAEKGEKSKLIKERKKLQKSLNDAVISGSIKKGSDEWFEMVSAINEVTNAIDESTQSIVEFQNALRQLKWDTFDKSMETVKRINSENDYYIDLMSHKDMTDKGTGNFTKYGTATIGLHKTNYDNYLAQADEYQREYNKIMRQIEKGELSTSDENVIQRLRDLQDAHREAKKSAEDELQSIQDLVKQGYEAQTDALSELIDKYKKLKDSELEAYKYQKEIAEKTKTIASLQKQLTAYNGNDSEESRAQIQKLKVQLEEAKNDLKDTQYEKFISDTEDMLDDLMNDYQEFINEKLNDTNNILDEIKTLLGSDIIETIKGLDSNLTNDTKDQIGSSTTNGGDGGQAAKDYVHNTVTNDQNKVNSKTDTSSYNPAKEADIAKKKNEIAQKKKAINEQRQSFQNQIKELESQLKQLYGELNSVENKYQFEKSSTKNKDKLQDLKNNYIEKKSGLNAMIQDVTHNKDVLQQFIADLDKQSAQLDTDLVSLKGYEKGSEHIDKSQLAWTQEDKREMIYRASDGAVLTKLNPGDKVFTNEMTENLWELAKMNPAQMYAGQFTPVTPDFSKSVNNSSNIEVTFGDLVLPDVTNSAEFADSVESVMREAICKNGKTTQCITEAVSAKQLGKNGIGNARLYK